MRLQLNAASKSPMTSHCCLRLTNQLEAVVTGWFGAWEGTWALNLLALRPSPADTMRRRELSGVQRCVLAFLRYLHPAGKG